MRAPAWIVEAIEEIDPGPALRRRVAEAQLVIAAEITPALEALSDKGKRVVFAQALWAGKFWQVPSTKRAREALTEANRLQREIRADAETLTAKLRQLAQLAESYGAPSGAPAFAECLQMIAKDDRFREWAITAEIQNTVRLTLTTSQAAPEMADLIECLTQTPTDEPVEILALRGAIRSRKSSADPQRVMLEALAMTTGHPEVPPAFRLSDAAVAALVHVVFGIECSAHSVKMARHR